MTEILDERGADAGERRARKRKGTTAARVPFSRTVFEAERADAARLFTALSEVTVLRSEKGGEGVRFSVPSRDAAKVVAICTSLCYNYKIIKEKGVLLFLLGALSRAGVAAGLVAGILLAVLYPMFVIEVEYTGDDIPAVVRTVEESGIRRWAFMPAFDADGLERELLALDGVAFASVTKTGTRVRIDVRAERRDGGMTEIPTGDVTASCDASVTRVVVRSGTAEVKTGDIVRAGDVLIGAYVTVGEERVPCAADGEVYGLKSYTFTRFFPDTELVREYGETRTFSRISFSDKAPAPPESPFPDYVLTVRAVRNGFLIGYTLYTYEFTEVRAEERENTRTAEEMEREAVGSALDALAPEAVVMSVSAKCTRTEGGTVVRVTVGTEERID